MSQRLVLPLDDSKINAGYKNQRYLKTWKYPHYGVDFGSVSKARRLFALGDGVVVAAGNDGPGGDPSKGCGYCLIVLYPDCLIHATGEVKSLVCTYMHMASLPPVREGQPLVQGVYLGDYGNTGAATSGPHLHIQFDTDTEHPLHCTGISSQGHAFLQRGAVDSTVDPLHILHKGPGQSLSYDSDSEWYSAADVEKVPTISPAVDVAILQKEVYRLRNENKNLLEAVRQIRAIVDAF